MKLTMSQTSNIDLVIGSRLHMQRLRHGLDEAALAEQINSTEQRVHEFESGLTRIDANTMRAICKALNLDLGYFFTPWTEVRQATDAALPALFGNRKALARAIKILDTARAALLSQAPRFTAGEQSEAA
jgi:transcriptional regulator with XRE-family HTH domain